MKKGEKMTAESREKMRISALKRFSDKRNHPKFGKKLSPQSLKNLSESHIGQKVSDETRKKLSDARKGDKHWNWKPDRTILILNWAEYPELRYKISNGITLCHSHHPRGREKEKRLSPYFMELVSVSK